MRIEVNVRKAAFCEMNDPWHKPHDFIEVTEWTNGEGWDIQISDNKLFSIHETEYEAIKKLIKHLNKYK